MPAVTRWWQALNPAIYLVSILPGVGVWILAENIPEEHAAIGFATAAVVLLQHAINLFNDAKDWQLGADHDKQDSWVRVHGGHPQIANTHGLLSLSAGTMLGLLTLTYYQSVWVLLYAFPFVVLGLFYNFGRRPLSYTSVGEWVTGICYGPGVFGSLWFVAGEPFNWISALGMLAFAALSMSLLFSHQPPQIETDRAAGKYSFAVRYGMKRTYQASATMFLISLLALGTAILMQQRGLMMNIVFYATVLIAVWRIFPVVKLSPKKIMINASIVCFMPALFLLLE